MNTYFIVRELFWYMFIMHNSQLVSRTEWYKSAHIFNASSDVLLLIFHYVLRKMSIPCRKVLYCEQMTTDGRFLLTVDYCFLSYHVWPWSWALSYIFKKSLKIPKGQSESVYRRRTYNTMAKRKYTNKGNNKITEHRANKRTNNNLQNIHIKLKIE